MSLQPSPTTSRQIVWPSVVTVISAAILIGIRAAQRVEPFTRRA